MAYADVENDEAFGQSDEALDQLSDDELRRLVALGVVPDKQEMLQRQLLQAQALRGRGPESRHTSPMGAMFHGLAGAGDSLRGVLEQEEAQRGLEGLQGEQVDTRLAFLRRLLGRGGKGKGGGGMRGMGGGSPMGDYEMPDMGGGMMG